MLAFGWQENIEPKLICLLKIVAQFDMVVNTFASYSLAFLLPRKLFMASRSMRQLANTGHRRNAAMPLFWIKPPKML